MSRSSDPNAIPNNGITFTYNSIKDEVFISVRKKDGEADIDNANALERTIFAAMKDKFGIIDFVIAHLSDSENIRCINALPGEISHEAEGETDQPTTQFIRLLHKIAYDYAVEKELNFNGEPPNAIQADHELIM